MTKDQIKQSLSMSQLLANQGLHPNRAGFIRCPFHKGDNTPSMKVYKASVYCFGCGWTGDVFKFYMDYNHCDFRTAFLALGGEYEAKDPKQRFAQTVAIQDAKRAQQRQEKAKTEAARRVRQATEDYWDSKLNLRFTEILYGQDSEQFWDAVGILGNAEMRLCEAEEEEGRLLDEQR